jgi:hypothetical protein
MAVKVNPLMLLQTARAIFSAAVAESYTQVFYFASIIIIDGQNPIL